MIERRVLPDADKLAAEAAGMVIEAILARPRETVAIALAGGSTPRRLYDALARRRDELAPAMRRVHWFVGDERLVAPDSPDSNGAMIRRHLTEPLCAPAENVHLVDTRGRSADDAAACYESDLRAFAEGDGRADPRPLFDVVLLGLGEDGHTASLFPGSPALDETARWAVGVEQAGLAPFVPRVTLTFAALASSRLTLILVAGSAKRPILGELASGRDLPASRIRSAGRLIWLLDRDAAGEAAAPSRAV